MTVGERKRDVLCSEEALLKKSSSAVEMPTRVHSEDTRGERRIRRIVKKRCILVIRMTTFPD